jgi:hypothetical protein
MLLLTKAASTSVDDKSEPDEHEGSDIQEDVDTDADRNDMSADGQNPFQGRQLSNDGDGGFMLAGVRQTDLQSKDFLQSK